MQEIKINGGNADQFLQLVTENYNLTDYFQVFVKLNTLLNSTAQLEVNISCSETYKFIKGTYISIKNVTDSITTENHCNEPESKFKKRNGILIFASNSVFIDEDIVARGDALAILSPKWVVIGNRTIDVSGVPGTRHLSLFDSKGRAGRPGKAGGPGGIFFGVGETFINGKNLTILANGGTGGDGEDGDIGIEGTDGKAPDLPSRASCLDNYYCKNGVKLNDFDCEQMKCERSYIPGARVGWAGIYQECEFRMLARPGQKGGKGGDGGRGGQGGYVGNATLFELTDPSGIFKRVDNGTEGRNGTGGAGGKDGKVEDDLLVKCTSGFRGNWVIKSSISVYNNITNLNGTSGLNVRNIESPKPTNITLDISDTVLEYKRYLREIMLSSQPNGTAYNKTTQFMNTLDNNELIKKNYKTITFVNELRSLEEMYPKYKEHDTFISFYQSLLDRMNEYSQNRNEAETSEDYTKILGYLHKNIMATINKIEQYDDSGMNLITNMSEYLGFLKENIETLKNMQRIKSKADIIYSYKKKYKENIDQRIEEAHSLIERVIIPEIDYNCAKLDSDINVLIDEVKNLKKVSLEEKSELSKKRDELENTAKLRILFGSVKIISSLVSFLGPIGAAFSIVGGTGSVALEALLLNNENNLSGTMFLPHMILADIERIRDRIITMKINKMNHLNMLLDNLNAQVEAYPDELGSLRDKVHTIKTKLDKINPHNFDFDTYKSMKNELKDELNRKKEVLEYDEIAKNTKNRKAVEAIKILELNAVLSSDMLLTYDKFKNDKLAAKEMTQTIEKNQDNFSRLEEYEEMIHKAIVPLVQNVNTDVHTLHSKLPTKHIVSLEVTKWQVKSILGNFKLQIQQLGDEIRVKTDFLICIQNLSDAMDILIDVYREIQQYRNKENLNNYIAEVVSENLNSIYVEDPELLRALGDLEIKLKSNYILARYKRAFGAFKQFVFPYAHKFLKDSVLPSHLKLSDNIDNLTHDVVSQIDNMILKLREYKEFVAQSGQFGKGEFDSSRDSVKPFFTWKNEENRDKIAEVLSDRGALLVSDVRNSSAHKDAIKFNNLFLNFKTKDPSKQAGLDALLKHFKITFTHQGTSHYRYDGKYYAIDTNRLEFWYSFEKNDKGEPSHTGGAYDSIKNADFMLSPYGYWFIKLTQMEDGKNVTFRELEVYKDQVYLELGGFARYLTDDKPTSAQDLKVEEYYQPIEDPDFIDRGAAKILNATSDHLARVKSSGRRRKRQIRSYKRGSKFFNKNFDTLPDAVAQGASLESEDVAGLQARGDSKSSLLGSIISLKDTVTNALSSTFQSIQDFSLKKIVKSDDGNGSSFASGSVNNTNAFYSNVSTLLLTWLLLGKKFDKKFAFRENRDYVSPDQERLIVVNDLYREISTILNEHRAFKINEIQSFLKAYEESPEWYQDALQDYADELKSNV